MLPSTFNQQKSNKKYTKLPRSSAPRQIHWHFGWISKINTKCTNEERPCRRWMKKKIKMWTTATSSSLQNISSTAFFIGFFIVCVCEWGDVVRIMMIAGKHFRFIPHHSNAISIHVCRITVVWVEYYKCVVCSVCTVYDFVLVLFWYATYTKHSIA